MEGYSYMAAFLSGILGVTHCIGMCSGVNAGFFAARGSVAGLSPVITYHAMRVATYSLLGIGGALLGRMLMQSGIVGKVQGVVMMLAGIWIVLIALKQFSIDQNKSSNGQVLRFIPDPAATKAPLMAGLVNGLIPCGLASTVAIQAAASADPVRAAMLMLAFGVGTLPAMMLLSVAGANVGAYREKYRIILVIALLGLGAWTFQQGAVFFNVIWGLGNW